VLLTLCFVGTLEQCTGKVISLILLTVVDMSINNAELATLYVLQIISVSQAEGPMTAYFYISFKMTTEHNPLDSLREGAMFVP
jgi:hypothetical protein